MRAQNPQRSLRVTRSNHGGARPGAGRPPNGTEPMVNHHRRPELNGKNPVLVTLAVRSGLGVDTFERVLGALQREASEPGARRTTSARFTEFAVQADRLQLIVEPCDKTSLSRGVQGLSVRIARAVNREMGRHGSVFVDRYEARPLRNRQEVQDAFEP